MSASIATRVLRLLFAMVLLSMAAYWGTDDELPMDAGTVVLALIAGYFVAFSQAKRSILLGAIFLVLVPVVQNAVDVYFEVGVQQKGLPWPWPTSKGAVGSVQEQVGQVATTAFVILALVGSAVFATKLVRLAQRKRSDA